MSVSWGAVIPQLLLTKEPSFSCALEGVKCGCWVESLGLMESSARNLTESIRKAGSEVSYYVYDEFTCLCPESFVGFFWGGTLSLAVTMTQVSMSCPCPCAPLFISCAENWQVFSPPADVTVYDAMQRSWYSLKHSVSLQPQDRSLIHAVLPGLQCCRQFMDCVSYCNALEQGIYEGHQFDGMLLILKPLFIHSRPDHRPLLTLFCQSCHVEVWKVADGSCCNTSGKASGYK